MYCIKGSACKEKVFNIKNRKMDKFFLFISKTRKIDNKTDIEFYTGKAKKCKEKENVDKNAKK